MMPRFALLKKISFAEETALLEEDEKSITESPEVTMQSLAKLMTSVNDNMAAVASSVALLGSTLKRSRDEFPGNSRHVGVVKPKS